MKIRIWRGEICPWLSSWAKVPACFYNRIIVVFLSFVFSIVLVLMQALWPIFPSKSWIMTVCRVPSDPCRWQERQVPQPEWPAAWTWPVYFWKTWRLLLPESEFMSKKSIMCVKRDALQLKLLHSQPWPYCTFFSRIYIYIYTSRLFSHLLIHYASLCMYKYVFQLENEWDLIFKQRICR